MDFVYLAAIAAFTALLVGFVAVCARTRDAGKERS